MDVFVAFEGFTLPSGFIVKELTILHPNGEYNHYIIKKPNHTYLNKQEERTVRYVTRHIHGINYNDGDVPYEQLNTILQKLEEYTIYTYSTVAETLLHALLPTTVVIDVKELGHNLPKELPNPNCFRHHIKYRYCSKAKAIAIKNFLYEDDTN